VGSRGREAAARLSLGSAGRRTSTKSTGSNRSCRSSWCCACRGLGLRPGHLPDFGDREHPNASDPRAV